MDTDPLKDTYNKIAHDYYRDHKADTWDDDFFGLFTKELAPHAKVLDLGCGPGVESKKLADRDFETYGFDFSDELLIIAKQEVPNASFVQGDMLEQFPYETNYFDGVFAKASLLHIPKERMDDVLREIVRVLKKGGILHVALKMGDGEKHVAEDDYGYSYERFFAYWQPDELRTLFASHQLAVVAEGTWTNPGKKTVWLKYLLRK